MFLVYFIQVCYVLILRWFNFVLFIVRAEDKEVPVNPKTQEVIDAIMSLSEEERSYINLFNMGKQ